MCIRDRYIDEWESGIRIEDDVLITEDGAVCLSEDIIRTTEDIEAYMACLLYTSRCV